MHPTQCPSLGDGVVYTRYRVHGIMPDDWWIILPAREYYRHCVGFFALA